jgi:hypothetical protein
LNQTAPRRGNSRFDLFGVCSSVEILQTASDPKLDVVSVTGLVSSEGWGFPQLIPTYAGRPFDDVLDLQFIAAAPAPLQLATGFVVVSAVLPLEPDPRFKGVRVRAVEKAISVLQVPGNNRATTQANDCKACLGRKFVPSGRHSPAITAQSGKRTYTNPH